MLSGQVSEFKAGGKPQTEGFSDEVKRLWEELIGQPLTDEDVREIASNLTAFFDLLNEWYEEALKSPNDPDRSCAAEKGEAV